MEATQMPMDWGTDKLIVENTCDVALYSHKKEWNTDTASNLEFPVVC